jgi:hypothetical protein
MQAVEAGQHEEGRAVDARSSLQVQVGVGVAVLVGLHAEEDEAEQDGEEQELQLSIRACSPSAPSARWSR